MVATNGASVGVGRAGMRLLSVAVWVVVLLVVGSANAQYPNGRRGPSNKSPGYRAPAAYSRHADYGVVIEALALMHSVGRRRSAGVLRSGRFDEHLRDLASYLAFSRQPLFARHARGLFRGLSREPFGVSRELPSDSVRNGPYGLVLADGTTPVLQEPPADRKGAGRIVRWQDSAAPGSPGQTTQGLVVGRSVQKGSKSFWVLTGIPDDPTGPDFAVHRIPRSDLSLVAEALK